MENVVTKKQINAAVVAKGGSTKYSGKLKTMFITGITISEGNSLETIGKLNFKLKY